jgi:hypothetical protein
VIYPENVFDVSLEKKIFFFKKRRFSKNRVFEAPCGRQVEEKTVQMPLPQ